MAGWGGGVRIGLGQTNHASALQQRLNRLAKGVEIRLGAGLAVQAEQIDGRDRNRSGKSSSTGAGCQCS